VLVSPSDDVVVVWSDVVQPENNSRLMKNKVRERKTLFMQCSFLLIISLKIITL
jgi:hypothetical protein